MKLAHILHEGRSLAALVTSAGYIDLTHGIGLPPGEIAAFAGCGETAARRALQYAERADAIPIDRARLGSPVLAPSKILGVGMNYRSFAAGIEKLGVPLPQQRIWFYRPQATITGPNDDIWMPEGTSDLEYEAELAVVIGRRATRLSPAEAASAIAGYTVANDVTFRDRVLTSLVFGKSFDRQLPLGPWLVTSDAIVDPQDLAIRTWVNGELRQDSTTAEMIDSVGELIAQVSAVAVLNPGDIILTGTPVGTGIFQKPPSVLQAGDVVRIEIDGIGQIENRIAIAPVSAA